MSDLTDTPQSDARTHLAWLMWCSSEGYTNAADRAILTNWLLDDPASLHPDDAALRPHLLAMADEILADPREQAKERVYQEVMRDVDRGLAVNATFNRLRALGRVE